jgi:FtsH-binding integral membrane protein
MNNYDYELTIDSSDRMAFIRKVYLILTIQLFFTAMIGFAFVADKSTQDYVQNNVALYIIALILPFPLLLALFYYKNQEPINLILLGVFTLCISYTVGIVITYYEVDSVIKSLFITVSLFFVLSIYTMYSKRDFSFMGAGLFAALWILIIVMILNIFLPFGSTGELLINLFGAILFSLMIIYDIYRLKDVYSADDYILAVIDLYLDIINLFLFILKLLGKKK